jgi:DNA-binding NarL/FixJ family response regulator
MTGFRDVFDDSALAELREHVRSLMANNGRGLLANEIVDFCARMETNHGITIDLQAVYDLGEPLVVVHPAAPARALPEHEHLTAREREVALLVCSGLSNKDVAKALYISPATVKDHVHRILQKTGLRSRAALAACYVNASIPVEER